MSQKKKRLRKAMLKKSRADEQSIHSCGDNAKVSSTFTGTGYKKKSKQRAFKKRPENDMPVHVEQSKFKHGQSFEKLDLRTIDKYKRARQKTVQEYDNNGIVIVKCPTFKNKAGS